MELLSSFRGDKYELWVVVNKQLPETGTINKLISSYNKQVQ